MNKYYSLTRVLIKNTSSKLTKDGKGKLPKTIILYAILIIAFLPLAGMLAGAVSVTFSFLKSMHQEGIILSVAMSITSTIIFVFGIFFVMSVFYFSSDIENLLTLPVKPSVILMSKFTIVLLYEYLTEAVIILPVLIAFGIKNNSGVLYYIYSIIIFLTLPIVPLIIDALISIFVMRFAGFTKNKDRFKTIAQMSGLIFAVAINISMQRIGRSASNGEEMAKLLTQGNNSLVKTSSKLFINIRYAAESLIDSNSLQGIINILIYFLITIILLVLFILLAERLYLKGAVGMTQTQSRRKKISSREIDKQSSQRSKIAAYTIKELNVLFRTPIYFTNCVIMNFLWPVFALIPLAAQPELLLKVKNAHTYFNTVFSSNTALGMSAAIAFGVSVMISMANPIASTAISREGKNIYVNKFIPMDYREQILSKVISAFILNLSGIMLLILLAAIITRPPVYLIITMILLSITGVIFADFVGIFIDLNYPKLEWDNEQRAVKQNINVMISLVIGLLVSGVIIVLTIKLKIVFSMVLAVILITFIVVNLLLYKVITTRGAELFKNIE